MALVLIKEDGTGKPDANAYAGMADGDAYHEGHLYATAWSAATTAQKEAALVMATRLIDAEYQFAGKRANATQALQWPRIDCQDPDGDSVLESDAVPKNVIDATCEMARELLIVDRTAAPAGEGLTYYNNAGVQTGYSKTDVRPVISHVAQAMLGKFGVMLKKGMGAVKLVRV